MSIVGSAAESARERHLLPAYLADITKVVALNKTSRNFELGSGGSSLRVKGLASVTTTARTINAAYGEE